MDESTRLLSWLLRNTLERYYAGNKTLMAKDFGIDRHTLWRTLHASEDGKGHISSLVAQQLLWCYMRYNFSLDDLIREYLEQSAQESTLQCDQIKNWVKNVQAGNLNIDSSLMMEIVKQVVPEWMIILQCDHLSDQQDSRSLHCKFKHACPILKLMEIAQSELRQFREAKALLDT